MSEAIPQQQAEDALLKHLAHLVQYWHRQSGTKLDAMNGLAFSILTMIDGSTMALPSIDLVLRPHPDDKDFAIGIGEDYWEDGMVINDGVLHEVWHKYQPESGADREDTSLLGVVRRIRAGEATSEDADRILKWIHPDEQAQTVMAYLHLTCNMSKARKYIAKDLRESLAAQLVKDSDDE